VGKSDKPKRRLEQHLQDSYGGQNHRENWVASLISRGSVPELEILDEVLMSEWPSWEVAYISFFRESGCVLTNATLGGEGMSGPSEETRRKLSVSRRGVKNPYFGRKHSVETRKKMALAKLGTKQSPETCERRSLVMRGENNPNFGKVLSGARREEIRISRIGSRHSTVTRARMSSSQKVRWKKRKELEHGTQS
jgi:group I intron endonuclease